MPIWEIINPSDKYTLQANDLQVAAVSVLLLGSGQYGLECHESPDLEVPLFLFGGAEEWFREKFGLSLEEAIKAVSRHHLADCLDSVVIGDRNSYELALSHIPEDRQRNFRTEWHDRHRSSLNDIGHRAWLIAERLRQDQAS